MGRVRVRLKRARTTTNRAIAQCFSRGLLDGRAPARCAPLSESVTEAELSRAQAVLMLVVDALESGDRNVLDEMRHGLELRPRTMEQRKALYVDAFERWMKWSQLNDPDDPTERRRRAPGAAETLEAWRRADSMPRRDGKRASRRGCSVLPPPEPASGPLPSRFPQRYAALRDHLAAWFDPAFAALTPMQVREALLSARTGPTGAASLALRVNALGFRVGDPSVASARERAASDLRAARSKWRKRCTPFSG